MTARSILHTWAHALGGDVVGRQVLCPGPGHSQRDRSLSVTISATSPDGFVVYSHAGDDWRDCRDHVRARLGLPAPEPRPHQPVTPRRFDDDERRRRNAEAAERIWHEAVHIEGTPGAAYFYKREIDITLLPDFGGLRWHRRCPWEGGPKGCVIARYTDAITGEPRGIWRRPITKDAKPRTLGAMAGCVIRLWPDYDVTIGLVLAEGVETAAAASLFEHRGTLLQPAWAAGCADNMEKFPVLPGVECLTLIVDNDRSGTGQDAAAACARRWLDAGREVIRLTPKIVGEDFNDIVCKTRGAA